MLKPDTLVGLAFAVIGCLFAFNSFRNGSTDTHWGFALTGIVCLVIGARFLGMPPVRDAVKKPGKPDPLD